MRRKKWGYERERRFCEFRLGFEFIVLNSTEWLYEFLLCFSLENCKRISYWILNLIFFSFLSINSNSDLKIGRINVGFRCVGLEFGWVFKLFLLNSNFIELKKQSSDGGCHFASIYSCYDFKWIWCPTKQAIELSFENPSLTPKEIVEASRSTAKVAATMIRVATEEKAAIIKRKWHFYPHSHGKHICLPSKNVTPSLKKYTLHVIIKHKRYIAWF